MHCCCSENQPIRLQPWNSNPIHGDGAARFNGCVPGAAVSYSAARRETFRYVYVNKHRSGGIAHGPKPNAARVTGWDGVTDEFVGSAHGQLSLAFMSAHPPILLGTLGMTDSLILMVMALVVFGPRRLPQIGRQIGKLMYEFRKASNDFKFQMEEELRNAEEADRRKKEEERQRALAAQTADRKSVV